MILDKTSCLGYVERCTFSGSQRSIFYVSKSLSPFHVYIIALVSSVINTQYTQTSSVIFVHIYT